MLKDVFTLESLRSDLLEKTLSSASSYMKLSLYHAYFDIILSSVNPDIQESFLTEFIDDYLSCVTRFQAYGSDPGITSKLIEQIQGLPSLPFVSDKADLFHTEISRLQNQFRKMQAVLDGHVYEDGHLRKAFFPLIDRQAPDNCYGIIESVTVRINKALDKDVFIIVPSEKEIEKRILEQFKASWFLALNLSRKYVSKPFHFHEVIISFDRKEGFYEGNSLGIALTLSFLEELLKFYNPSYVIKIKEQTAFTGGVSSSGNIGFLGEEITSRKTAAVFFSNAGKLCLPKEDEDYALTTLKKLKDRYPQRNLKIVPASDINDILNRRDLVDIQKKPLVQRGVKFLKKNWKSAAAVVIFTILFTIYFGVDTDKNPSSLDTDGYTLFVKNSKGKVLWTKGTSIDPDVLSKHAIIADIDRNGENEIILSSYNSDAAYPHIVVCYNKDAEIIWEYSFRDKVYSDRENPDTIYGFKILDTLTFNGVPSLFLITTNNNNFSSAVIRIRLTDGTRLKGTLWCSGHVVDGLFINNKEALLLGFDNGYEDAVLFNYYLDTLTKVRPTTQGYLIRNFPLQEVKNYIRFPKTDYDNYLGIRTPDLTKTILKDEKHRKLFKFSTMIGNEPQIGYEVDYNFKDVNIVVASYFRVNRDSLITKGFLNYPETDSEAYKEIIKNNILYWRNGSWIKRKELQ